MMDVIEGTANDSSGLKEIERMDVVLAFKATQKEEARMSRVEVEEESVCALINLMECHEVPAAIKKNVSNYLELINELQSISAGNHKRRKNSELSKKRSKCKIQYLLKHGSIAEKNCQPSKCRMGTWSMTDKEKDRLNCILAEERTFVQEENGFRPDAATVAILKRIDCELMAKRSETEVEKTPPVIKVYDVFLKNRLRKIDKMLDAFQSTSCIWHDFS